MLQCRENWADRLETAMCAGGGVSWHDIKGQAKTQIQLKEGSLCHSPLT